MKIIVFLSLWALAWSVPMRGGIFQPTNWLGLQRYGQGTNQLWQQQNSVLPNEIGQHNFQSQQISELLNQDKRQNVVLQQQGMNRNTWQQDTQNNVAVQQTAWTIVQQLQEQKQTLVQTAIQQLQQQLQQLQQVNVIQLQSVTKQAQQVEIIAAIQQLQQVQNLISNQVPQRSLVQTLEVAIEAQLVSNAVANQEVTQYGEINKIPVQTAEGLQAGVQQLINQIAVEDIQVEITKQQTNIQQLQQQQQFVNNQRQQIQTETLIVAQQSQSQQLSQQLQQVQQNLQQQEQQLVQQQLVRQLVVRQLQQVVIDLQNELQQDTLNEQIQEQVSQVPWSQVGSLQVGNIWSQLPQYQVANLLSNSPRGLRIGTNSLRSVIPGVQVSMSGLSQ